MRRVRPLLCVWRCCGPASSWAQHSGSAAVPQTARQALIEMFFSKTPGTLVKHLPAATRAALEKSGALANATAVFADGEPTPDARTERADV